jgi:hypothetical protein
VLVALGAILALFLFLGRGGTEATVTVTPPAKKSGREINNIILPASAIDGIPLETTVSVERTGQVAGETLAPISQARGSVMIANRLFEDITLEKGKAVATTRPSRCRPRRRPSRA